MNEGLKSHFKARSRSTALQVQTWTESFCIREEMCSMEVKKEFCTKRSLFRKTNRARSTCTVRLEVRAQTCSLHTFLTEKMCQPYLSCGGQGLGLLFFVQTHSSRWRSRAQFVSYRAETDHWKAGSHQQGGCELTF